MKGSARAPAATRPTRRATPSGGRRAASEHSFYTDAELRGVGFRTFGRRVRISRKTSIYEPGTISIGNDVRIDDYCVLAGGKGIELGNYVHIACFCGLFGGGGIAMEDFAGLSARVLIYSKSDDYSGRSLTNPTVPDRYKPGLHMAKVILRRHVIVGANSTILPGAVLDEGVAIGAYSLVTARCDPWWIYAGVPARKLRSRSQALLELERELAGASRSSRTG
jgi:dTDP-4-amino-4,6-dideoxy-D-glucose acyltransferase